MEQLELYWFCFMIYRAIMILNDQGETHNEAAHVLQQMVDMRLKCHNNMAAGLMQVGLQ